MSRFRPCIDLHQGEVKQIVGGTLKDDSSGPQENFVSRRPSTWFATRYREDRLTGGHVIKLGPGNDQAAKEALQRIHPVCKLVEVSPPTTQWSGSMRVRVT